MSSVDSDLTDDLLQIDESTVDSLSEQVHLHAVIPQSKR